MHSRPLNNYSIHFSSVSLSKVSYAKKKDMGYAKKISCQRHERKKFMPKSMKKRKENKKMIAHTFK
jgi:hypothetical protein